jgi:hypothetical protein
MPVSFIIYRVNMTISLDTLLVVLCRASKELKEVSNALGTDGESRTAECGRKMAALCDVTIAAAEEQIRLAPKKLELLDELVKVLKEFPGHVSESAWNEWLFKREVVLSHAKELDI